MHPCSSQNKQLESVSFQSSACASIQASLNVVKVICLSDIVIDYSVNDALVKFKKLFFNRDEYWDDEFQFKDDDLLPLSRFDIIKTVSDEKIPPIEIYKRNGKWVYNDGRHRHLRLLIRNQCNPNFVLVENVHYVFSYDSEMKEDDVIKYLVLEKSKLFVLDVYKKSFTQVHINDFKRRNLPCFEYKDWTIKYIGTRDESKKLVAKLKTLIYEPQILEETFSHVKNQFVDFLSGLGAIFEVVAGIGRTSNYVSEKYAQFREAFVIPNCATDMWAHVKRQVTQKFGLGLVKILLSISRMISESGFSALSLASLMLEVFDLVVDSPLYQSQSLETILVAGISSLLPTCITNIIKKMSLLTSKKLFDEANFIFDFFTSVSHLLKTLISYFPESLQLYLQNVLDLFGLSEFIYIQRAKLIIAEFSKDKHVILKDDFRNKVKALDSEFKAIDLKKFFSKNKPLSDVAVEFERIVKAVNSYEQTSRQEPCCFVFEGPPGSRKSVTVNKLIAVLGLTHYSHIVKCSEDSKDWYDSYNNEDIFYMDDVGQMGKSQWRNLINWVSAVKLPLDCAEAKLKDTKYFNSELILLTTNNFSHLQGFTSKDCIETPEALWRRGYVFDFANVRGIGDKMEGEAFFKYYDINTKQFIQDFPTDFKEFLEVEQVTLSVNCDVSQQNSFLTWMSTIVLGLKKMKKQQLNNNTLDESDIKFVRASNPFSAQSKLEDVKNLVVEYFNFALDVCKDLIGDMLSLLLNNPLMAAGGLVTCMLVSALIYKCKSFFESEGGFLTKIENKDFSCIADNFESLDLSTSHSMLPKLASQMFEIDMVFTENGLQKLVSCHSLISGRKLLVPYHLVLDRKLQVVVYKNRSKNYRLIDHSPVNLVYKNIENDVAIVALSDGFPSPFPKLASCFQPNSDQVVGLVFPSKIIKLEGILNSASNDGPIIYPVGEITNSIIDPITYDGLHFAGMCGTLATTTQGMLVGMHVAGHSGKNVGATLRWSSKCKDDLFRIFSDLDLGLKINVKISDKDYENCSATKIETDLNVYVPKNSNFVKSPLFGVFENSRKPANLSVYGPHTVKDVSKSSRGTIGPVDEEELAFASDLLNLYFEDFDDLNEFEIVKGDEMLAPINKKSSNGIFPIKSKLDCFDFEKGIFKEDFKNLYVEFEERMSTGDVEISDIAWSETLKDELRNVEKKEPRSFRVSPVTMQVLTKKCFGKMVKKIVKERWFNEIMIGLNPFSEWPKLHKRMQGGRCWGGDIGKYDKNMRVQVQIMVAESILKFYKGKHYQAAKNILLNIAYNIVVVNDDSWILNHSLPSGCWLTAIFNSLVNRVYTAMWYYRELKNNGIVAKALHFHEDISDPVYGDDRLNRCIKEKYQGFLNALTMEKFFNSLGMDMTDSLKNKIVTPFQDISELTFLKRYFRFHPKLLNVTCPLDLRTVYSTISWIDKSKDDLDVVLRDKLNAFQREIFLHYDLYDQDIAKLEKACDEKLINVVILPESYLIKLYNSGLYDDFYAKAYDLLVV